MKTKVVGGLPPTQESDDEQADLNSYTEREMNSNPNLTLLPFNGTYDIFEKLDFFTSPQEVEFSDPIGFLKIDYDEEALEVLDQSLSPFRPPRLVVDPPAAKTTSRNSFMDSPISQDDENAWLEREDISKLMNEIKIKYMKREFKDMDIIQFQRVKEDSFDNEDYQKKRCFELIYLNQKVYLVIKEVAREINTEEIYFNLIVVRFDPKTKEVKELFKKQLNNNPLKTIGFTCERISFIRYQQCLYFFVYDRNFETQSNVCILQKFDLLEEVFSTVKQFTIPFEKDQPLLMVSISKNWFDFNLAAKIELNSVANEELFLNFVCFSMIYKTSSLLVKEYIYLLNKVDTIMATIKSVHNMSPSSVFFVNNHEKKLNSAIEEIKKKLRAYLAKKILSRHDEQRGELFVKKDFVAWIGHINLEHGYKFWRREQIDGIDHLNEISLKQVLESYIGYRELPYEESVIVFKQMISDTLTLQSNGCLYPTIHTVSKNLGAETNYRSQKKSLKFPEEFDLFREQIFPNIKKDNNAYTILNNVLKKEYFFIINNWSDDNDNIFFIRNEMPKNFIESNKLIKSKIQQNMEAVLKYTRTNAQICVINQNFSNVFRDKENIYVTIQTDDGIKLKVIKDGQMSLKKFNSPTLQLCEETDNLKKYNANLGNQVGFWDWKSFFHDFRTNKSYKIEIDGRPNVVPLKFTETNQEYMDLPKEKLTHIEMIYQKVKIAQDDRWEVPFLAVQPRAVDTTIPRNLWFAVLDLKVMKVVKAIFVDITNLEQGYLQRIGVQMWEHIRFLANGSVQREEERYCQNYQVIFSYLKLKRVKIMDYKIVWTPKPKGKGYFVDANQIGMRELIFQEDLKIANIDFYPVFDDKGLSQFNRLQCQYQNDSIGIVDLKNNFDNFTFNSKNDMVKFGYKIYTNSYSSIIDLLLTESYLLDEIFENASNLTSFSISQILSLQIKTVNNMIPYDFVNWCKRSAEKPMQFFKPIQLLQGHSLSNFKIWDPKLIKNEIIKFGDQIGIQDPAYKTLFEQVLERDETNTRMMVFRELGILYQPNEISHDFHQNSTLDRCFQEECDYMITADILIKHLLSLKRTATAGIRNILMCALPRILESEVKSNQFLNFFMDPDLDESEDPDIKYKVIKFRNLIRDTYDVLPKYQDDELKVVYLSLNNLSIVKIDINEYMLNKILADSDPNGTENLMMYSFIDFRQLYLREVRKNLTAKNAKITFTEFELSNYIRSFIDKYGDVVEQSSGVCNLIDDQFEMTKTFYKKFFKIYFFGYVVPFMIQLRLSYMEKNSILLALFTCCITQTIFFGLEIIQMSDCGLWDYFNDFWNMVDIIQIFLFYYYSSIRMVKMRLLLPNEITAAINAGINEEQTLDQYHSIALMAFFNVFLLSMATLKIFFFLRIYDEFGLLVQLFLQVLSDVTTFSTFFGGWIVLFAVIFQTMGIAFDEGDYPNLGTFTKYLMYSYRNSIGDINPPLYDFWSSRIEESATVSTLMIGMVWFAWLANQFIMLITLLNFLITIMGQTYDQVMEQSIIRKYADRSDLNRECRLVYRFFNLLPPIDSSFICSMDNSEDLAGGDNHMGFVKSIKDFVLAENAKILAKNGAKNEEMKELMRGQMQLMKEEMKMQRVNTVNEIKKLLELKENEIK